MRSMLITGANKGIGLELVKQFLNHLLVKPEILIATVRNPSDAKELEELASKDTSLHILQLDSNNFDSYDEFAENVGQIVGEEGLNVLINNLGFMHNREVNAETLIQESIHTQYIANTAAPIVLTMKLIPLLTKAAKLKSGCISIDRAAVLIVSTVLGSNSNNISSFGRGFWAHNSKMSLEKSVAILSEDIKSYGIGVFVFHQSFVQLDLDGPNALATTTERLINSILNLSNKPSGSVIYYGEPDLPSLFMHN